MRHAERGSVWSSCNTAATVLWATEALLVAWLLVVLHGAAGALIDDVALVNSISVVSLCGMSVSHAAGE
jgi:hypothetical protein